MMNKPVNKIEKLIEELCPEGVEFEMLGEVGKVCMCKRIFKNQTSTTGQIPFYKIGTFGNTPNAFIAQEIFDEYRRKFSFPKKGDVLLSASGTIGRRVIYDGEPAYFQDSNIIWIDNNESKVLNMFLYYLYSIVTWQTEGGTIKRLYNDNLKKIQIPIPPITIQKEIVKILDNFTRLEAELEAELEARKKQYEHYREELLTFGDDVEFRALGEVCEFRNGKGHEKKIDENGKYIVVNSKFVSTEGKVKKYSAEQISPIFKDDILMVMSDLPNGKALAKCFRVDHNDKYTLNQRICSLTVKDNDHLNAKYLFFILSRNRQLLRYDNGVDQTNLRKNDILKIQIPIPPLSKQKEIVAILDKFNALANDISTGLPAEISARKKQYEYYRNQLLTFKPLELQDAN